MSGRIPAEERATRLRYVVWEITLRCDLSCNHCGSRAGKPRSDELSTAEAIDVVDQLAAMGTHEIVLIGGEAYLREDWTAIVRAIADRGMRSTMVTGGRGMTRERAQAARDAGMSAMSVSLDGIGPTHDLQRGLEGAFDAATSALENIHAAGLELFGNSQINRLSFPELESIYEHLRAHGATGWQLSITVPMGRAAERPHWLLQPFELLEVFETLAHLARRGAEEGMPIFPGNNVGYFGPYETLLRGRGLRDDRAWGGCIAGKSALGIESDGSIKGCPSLPSDRWVGGNVRESSIRAIWDEAPSLRYVRERELDDLWGYCRSCYYAEVCRGGCTWTSNVTLGKPGNNPYCHHRALDHRRRGLRERLVQREAAPGVPFDHGAFELVEEPWEEPAPIAPPKSARLRVLR